MPDIISETTELERYWKPRNDQMLLDREMIHLVKPVERLGQPKWVSNEPKIFYDTSVALVSSYPPRFRHPLTINFKPEEKEKMNKAERFTLGIFRSLDRRQFDRGQTYWLRELAYWMMSGWYANFSMVRENNGQVDFISDHWDPMTVYPEWDSDGLVKCVRAFEVDKKTAMGMVNNWLAKGLKTTFKEPSADATIKVINYWMLKRNPKRNTVYNAIYVAGQPIKELKLEPQFDHIPIHVGAIGVPERGTEGWVARRGENIIAANRDMYEYDNQIMSLMVEIMAATAYPNLISESQTGAPVVKAEDVRGHGQVLPLKRGDKLDLLKHAATPAEALQLSAKIDRQKQKGSIPDIVYGGVPFELSGFAISQLMASIRYKIAPYLNTMQYVISQIASDFLIQYKKGKFPKVTLSTTNPQELKKGLFFVEEFSRQDVPESTYVEVTIPITSALDKTQQIMFARQAMSPPQLLSRETIWDEVLDVQDSEQEYARILQDQVLEMDVVKQIGMIEQLKVRQRIFENEGKIAEANALKQYIMALEMQLGMRQGIPTTPGAPGVSPSAGPPEMGMAGTSPDVTRAALGVAPSGLSRRPQTPTEREAGRGRMGTLVSPTGERLL